MKGNLNEKESSDCFILKCKECNSKLTDNICQNNIERLVIKDKDFYALCITHFCFFLFSGKNKLCNLSKESFLYDDVSCIHCKKKFGKIIKSCRDQYTKYINDYFIVKTKRVYLEHISSIQIHQIKTKPILYSSVQSVNKELDKLISLSKKYSINYEKSIEEYNTLVDFYLITKNSYEEILNNLEKHSLTIDKNRSGKHKENVDNLDKTTAMIRFSADKLENSIMYTEIKGKNENRLNFRVKNYSKEDKSFTKRKKF